MSPCNGVRFQSGQKVAYGIIDNDTVTEVTGSPFENYAKTASTYPLSARQIAGAGDPADLLCGRHQLP